MARVWRRIVIQGLAAEQRRCRSPRNSPPKDTAEAKSAAEMNIQLDRAVITGLRDKTFLAAGPASERGRSPWTRNKYPMVALINLVAAVLTTKNPAMSANCVAVARLRPCLGHRRLQGWPACIPDAMAASHSASTSTISVTSGCQSATMHHCTGFVNHSPS